MSPRKRPLYMGVDIHYGSPSSTRGARYYVALVDEEGNLVSRAPEASIARVIRIAWEARPRILAVDNPYELASNNRDLARILSMLPPDTNVVQVNMDEHGPIDLREAARRAGVDPGPGKPSPGRTAYLLAVLASRGVGRPLRIVEEKTLIIVSRGRGGSGGGWSQQRFQRRVRASVQQAASRIKEALERAGLEYDYRYRSSVGGLESAVFTVYAPRARLRGIVRPHRGLDYTVEVKPVYTARLYLDNDTGRHVIVGIDPGITTGIAVLDLNGRILHLASHKGIDRGAIIQEILRHGTPVMVATDVNPPPEAVKSIASKLGADLYTPPEDLSTDEKRELASRAGVKPRDSHQRDALAAALRAYHNLKSKMAQIDSYLHSIDLDLDREQVKAEVLRGSTVAEAVERQIMNILSPRQEEARQAPRQEGRRQEQQEDYTRIIEGLRAEKRRLLDKITTLEAELERERINARLAIQQARAEAYRDHELKVLAERLEKMEGEVERLKERLEEAERRNRDLERILEDLASGSKVLASRVKVLSKRNLNKIRRGTKILVVEDPNTFEKAAIQRLEEMGIKAVIVEEGPLANSLRTRNIPSIPPGKYQVEDLWGIILVDANILEEAERERKRLVESKKRTIDLEKLVNEYRMNRILSEGGRL